MTSTMGNFNELFHRSTRQLTGLDLRCMNFPDTLLIDGGPLMDLLKNYYCVPAGLLVIVSQTAHMISKGMIENSSQLTSPL